MSVVVEEARPGPGPAVADRGEWERRATELVARLLPARVVTAAAFGDPPQAVLLPAEEQALGRVADKRRREFTTVRHCARTALAGLGLPPVPLLPGGSGEPCWPAGVVGSMSHCEGYRVAAVARPADMVALGVDAEPNLALRPGTLELVSDPQERRMLDALARSRPEVHWDRLLFSAKEAVYKAWFPLTGAWLDFDQARISFEPDGHAFRAALLVPGPVVDGVRLTGFEGRWTLGRELLVTAIAVPRARRGRPPQRGPSTAVG